MRRLLLFLALAVVVAVPAPAAAATRLAVVDEATPLRTWSGTTATSVRDGATGAYRLALLQDDGTLTPLPVAPRAVPFDADVGPGPDGTAAIVYSRCAREAQGSLGRPAGCSLQLFDPRDGVERRLATTDSPVASETTPTIWRDRIAWVRTLDGDRDARPIVYTRSLRSPSRVRSQRLPGLPSCRPSDVDGGPCRPTRGSFSELELYGRWLGQAATYFYDGVSGICGRREVRLVTLDRRARQTADTICGLSGQSHLGLSFVAGHLLWARVCPGDDGGCATTGGVWRYGLGDRGYELASLDVPGAPPPGYAGLDGFAAESLRGGLAGVNAWCGPDEESDCGRIFRDDGLAFRPARAPR